LGTGKRVRVLTRGHGARPTQKETKVAWLLGKNHSNENFGKIFELGNTFRTCAFWTFVCKLNFQRRFRMSSAELRRGAKLAGASKKRCSNGLCIEFLRAMLLKIEGASVWRRWAHKITAFNGGFQVLVAVYLFNSYLCTFSL